MPPYKPTRGGQCYTENCTVHSWKLENMLKTQELFRPQLKLRLDYFYSNLSKCENKSKWSAINQYYSSA